MFNHHSSHLHPCNYCRIYFWKMKTTATKHPDGHVVITHLVTYFEKHPSGLSFRKNTVDYEFELTVAEAKELWEQLTELLTYWGDSNEN